MSKKRLYEIAKEVGVESKVVVAKAQELGLSVKSHSSSVEEADANRITSSLKGGAVKAESKPASKVAPAPKEEKVAPKVVEAPASKPTPAKKSPKAEEKETPATPKKPQSRNFKAEREARAKAEAERRQNGGGRDNRNRNRNQQGNDQGKRQNNDRRNQNGNGQGNRNNGNRDNNSNRDRNFQGKQRNDQGRNKRNDAARNNQAGPRIDFKARAAALKAEQNAEYSRQSETRFREEKAAEQRRAKEQEKARKEKQQAEVAAQKAVAEAKPAPKPAPAAQAQDTRRKKARPDKSRDNRRENEDGPKQTRNNKWNNQNQVRNQRNSNWNKNKNKKGKNNRGNSAPKPVTERKFHELPKEFEYTEGMTVAEIAKRIKREPAEIVKKLFMMGVMATQNQSLDGDTIELLMVDYGIEATKKEEVDNADIERFFVDEDYLNKDAMVERAPVVTIMGHVDHGKTTLLDTLRNSRVATGEAGGITQHIGAYQIEEGGKKITFLDTPGHEAFAAMRARGTQVTDIAIIIIAADDSVMPTTKEAIAHAQAAGVPMVFAINKIDKPGANPDKIREDLSQMNLLVEEWGGKYQCQEISAKKGLGVADLLDKVLLEADMLDLKANPNRNATGTVIESSLDKGRGYVSTVLVSNGTLKVGDNMIAGTSWGRIKAMFNERNQRVEKAGPSEPVIILGLNGAPTAGDTFHVMETEQEARDIANKREQLQREQGLRTQTRLTLSDISHRIARGEFHEMNIIVKGDTDGSIEALADSFIKLSTEKVNVNVISKAVGQISENDVMLAAASDAVIVGFQVRPSADARKLADRDGVEINTYSVIYDAIDDVTSAMVGMLDKVKKEIVTGQVEVQQVFKISKVGTVAGCIVTEGKVHSKDKGRVIRDGIVIHTAPISALKRYKDDVKEVVTGLECGISLVNYNDLQTGDMIETFTEIEVEQKL